MSEPRMLHTMLRVRDLDRSVGFYTGPMGMKELRRREVPDGRYTLAFVGYGDEQSQAVVELTHNWDQEQPYEIGSGFGHLAVGLPDIKAACERVRDRGRQGDARAWPGEVRHDRDRFRRGPGRLQDRADRAALTLLDEAFAAARSLAPRTIRVGLTGLARAGKTAFLTSLAANLLATGAGRPALPRLAQRLGGRPFRVVLAPGGAGDVPRFDYAAHLAALAADPPRWPARTDAVSLLALDLTLGRAGIASALPPQQVRLEVLDYPGEWLLDLPLLREGFPGLVRGRAAPAGGAGGGARVPRLRRGPARRGAGERRPGRVRASPLSRGAAPPARRCPG